MMVMVGYGAGRYQHEVADFDAVGFYYHILLVEIVRCLPRVVRHVESRKCSICSLVDLTRTHPHPVLDSGECASPTHSAKSPRTTGYSQILKYSVDLG